MRRLSTIFIILLSVLTAGAQDLAGGFKPAPFNAHNYTVGHKRSSELPAKYDSRETGYVTTPRNQVINGTCWAFATCDAMEVTSAKQGFSDGYYSPQMFTNCHDGFLWGKSNGGNADMATAMLATLKSPVYEDDFPFDAYDNTCKTVGDSAYAAYYLGAWFLPSDDATAIKECIYDYGAVFAQMHYSRNYYDEENYKYCYTGDDDANHAISLVGWDDDERVYIAKFNWGAEQFDDGYVYVSYDDVVIETGCVAFPQRVETSEIDTVYTYSNTGRISWLDWSSDPKVNLVSTISYFEASENDTITYVGTYTINPDVKLTFTLQDVTTEAFSVQEAECKYAGLQVIKLNQPFVVKGKFLLAVDYPDVTVPVETAIEGYNTVDVQSSDLQMMQINNSQTIGVGTGSKYYSELNLCNYAYAKHAVEEPTPTDASEAAAEYTAPVIGGRINPAVFETASEMAIYSLDGVQIEYLTSYKDINREGLYIFVVRYSDGIVKRSLEMLY